MYKTEPPVKIDISPFSYNLMIYMLKRNTDCYSDSPGIRDRAEILIKRFGKAARLCRGQSETVGEYSYIALGLHPVEAEWLIDQLLLYGGMFAVQDERGIENRAEKLK